MVDVELGTPYTLARGRTAIEVWRESAPDEWEEISDRLTAEQVMVGSDEQIDRLQASYGFGEGRFPLVDDGGVFQSNYLARALADLDPNRLVRIFIGHPDDDGKICLFSGHPGLHTISWGANPQSHDQGMRIECESVLSRWSDDERCQVIGRYVHGNFADPAGTPGRPILYDEDNLRLIESQPCIFNEDGEPNCSPHPIKVFFDVPDRQQSIEVPLYVFTARRVRKEGQNDQELDVRYWTFARAMVYLLYFYAQKPFLEAGEQPPIAITGDLIDRLIAGEPNLLDQEPPDNPLAIDDLFDRAMLGKTDDVVTDRTSLREALLLLCRDGTIHFNAEYLTVDAPADVTTVCKFWVAGHGYWEGADQTDYGVGRTPPRVNLPGSDRVRLSTNRHMQAALTYDSRETVNAPIIVGDTGLYEVTVELVPAWLPYTKLDNVASPDVDAAKESWQPLGPGSGLDAGNLARFRTSHEDHHQVADVGRKWALNESGRYPAKDAQDVERYARTVGPFDAAKYKTFNFNSIPIMDYEFVGDDLDLNEQVFPSWPMRPRPFRDPLTKMPGGETGPYVEVSFDSGVTWHHEKRVGFNPTEAAIIFAPESPLEITPPGLPWYEGPLGGTNMFYAIIEGRFRVRVTAAVAGDRLMIPRRGAEARHGLTSVLERIKARVYDRPGNQYELRTEMDSALSQRNPTGDHDEQMDMENAEKLRRSLGRAVADRQIAMDPVTQWLDLGVRVGMRITLVGGTGLPTEMRTGDQDMYPTVVGLIHQLDGVQTTSVVVSDFRHELEEVAAP